MKVVGHVLCGLLQDATWIKDVLVLRKKLFDGAGLAVPLCPSRWGGEGGCCGGVEVALGGGLLVKVKSPLRMAAAASPSAAAGG